MARKKPPGHSSKLSGPKRFGLYFDESQRVHPESGQSQYVFTAALLHQKAKPELERKYLKLRQTMTQACLDVVPHLSSHKDFRGGLLEIHAVDMYQSKGIYNQVKKREPQFWKRQHDWIESALMYAKQAGVKYFAAPIDSDTYRELFNLDTITLAGRQDLGVHKRVADKFTSLAKNPYFIGLPLVLREVDAYLARNEGVSDVYCHTNEETEGFSVLQSLEYVQSRGHLARLKPPVFRSCSEAQAIQAADVAGYVILQREYARKFDTPLKPEFEYWFTEYVQPRLFLDFTDIDTAQSQALALLTFETLLRASGGSPEFRQLISKVIPLTAQWLLEGELPSHMLLEQLKLSVFDSGSIFTKAQTYKPPSEDGDLSG